MRFAVYKISEIQAPSSFCSHAVWFAFNLVEKKTNKFYGDESIRFKRPGCHMIRRPNYFDLYINILCKMHFVTAFRFKFQCPLKKRVICTLQCEMYTYNRRIFKHGTQEYFK